MPGRRSAIVSAALLAVLASPMAIAHSPVYGVQDCQTPKVRPTVMVLTCGDAGVYIEALRWRRWGGSIAVGTGVYNENTCVPSCAGGRLRTRRATVWLGDVGRCRGFGSRRFYRRVKVSGSTTSWGRQCPS